MNAHSHRKAISSDINSRVRKGLGGGKRQRTWWYDNYSKKLDLNVKTCQVISIGLCFLSCALQIFRAKTIMPKRENLFPGLQRMDNHATQTSYWEEGQNDIQCWPYVGDPWWALEYSYPPRQVQGWEAELGFSLHDTGSPSEVHRRLTAPVLFALSEDSPGNRGKPLSYHVILPVTRSMIAPHVG